jgi:toxin-antitoxin system PIN domain toxin
MSFGVDVNILLYASDTESPQHAKARAFLASCATGPEMFCVAWLTLMSYLRMATHPAIFRHPLSHAHAMRNVEALITVPMCRVLSEEDGFWDIYRGLTDEVPTRGNLVPDAHLAAVLLQHGVVRVYTHDRDFRKFSALRVVDPLS